MKKDGFRVTAYTLCLSIGAAEATALTLMVGFPALFGGVEPTMLDWKILEIGGTGFFVMALLAGAAYFSRRRQR